MFFGNQMQSDIDAINANKDLGELITRFIRYDVNRDVTKTLSQSLINSQLMSSPQTQTTSQPKPKPAPKKRKVVIPKILNDATKTKSDSAWSW